MVSQFKSPDDVRLLKDLAFDFPEGTHAIGRLDNDSEGLLILTTNKKVTRLMYSGSKKHERSYLVMVQNKVSQESFLRLQEGIEIKAQGGEQYVAKPVSVQIVNDPLIVYPFASDEREKFPHTWLMITLTEGKFRQVRKMMMAIKHKCLRLIRVSIGDMKLDLSPGDVREIDEETLFNSIGLDAS